ncbi:energy transducer TonB [Roseiconus lacunae]|uniref:energy transducer TonB n=1 Tax=Roseiconus lacunae TaxID=2605694 RepID=UPI001E3749E4|nr:energy transducer TonB [Roseiconus lacunae]MCD0463310.1 energy transducer TonB [Roseiconus lacunae]
MNAPQKSLGISLSLHLLVVSFLYAFPDSATRRFSSSGRVQVISIEASQSQPVEETSTEVPVEVLPTESPSPVTESTEPIERQLNEPTFALQDRNDRAKRPDGSTRSPQKQFSPLDVSRKVVPAASPPLPPMTKPRQVARRPPVRKPAVSIPKATPIIVDQVVGVKQDKQADLSDNAPPPYPTEAIRGGLEGVVLLRLTISREGKVTNVQVLQSSGYSILDNAATKAVKQWRGRPATRWGRPVESSEVLPIRFRR